MKTKNGLRKLLAGFLVAVLLLTAAPLASLSDLDLSGVADWFSTTAKAATEGYLTYEVENGEATITGCDSSISGELIIPSMLGGYPVTRIGEYAFYGCAGLTSVTIPDSVTSIGGHAFSGTAYYNNSDNWEDGVLYIGNHLIEAEQTISGAYEIKNGTKSIAEYAFYGCSYLRSVEFNNSITIIGVMAFYLCTSLTSITLPDSITSIGGYAFGRCSKLANINILSGFINIGGDAFSDTAFYNNANNWDKEVLYIGNHLIEARDTLSGTYEIKKGTKCIADFAFRNCDGMISVIIPEGVVCIGDSSFAYCSGLIGITIPNSVISIGYSAFYACKRLTKIIIPDSVLIIGAQAFSCCSNLRNVEIGNGLTYIGQFVFFNCCSGLTIWGYPGTLAEAYAVENGFIFVDLSHKHVYTENVTKPATCTEAGLKTFTCSCGRTYSEKIPAIGHNYQPVVVEPTCVSIGYETSTCENCGESRFVRAIPATGHKEVIIEGKSATCTESGLTEGKKCSVCGVVLEEQKEIPALKHDIVVDVEAKKATCTEAGTTKGVHCTRCDYKVEAEEIEPLGHTDEDNDGKCDTCGESLGTTPEEPENPSENCSCACHKKGIAKLFFKIGLFFQKIFKKNKVCKCGVWHY